MRVCPEPSLSRRVQLYSTCITTGSLGVQLEVLLVQSVSCILVPVA